MVGGIRVPVPDGSLTDITFNVNVKFLLKKSIKHLKKRLKLILKNFRLHRRPNCFCGYYWKSKFCLFDAQLTSVIDKMVKIVGW